MMSCYMMSGNEVWQFGGLISQHFRTQKKKKKKKIFFFFFFFFALTKGTACLQNLSYNIS